MLNDIKNTLAVALATLSELEVVYTYLKADPSGYPCAMVRINSSGESRLDTANNLATAKFTIVVALREANTEDAETQRLDLMDLVPALFREKTLVDTLGGLVEIFDVTDCQAMDSYADQPLTGFYFVVSASKIMPIL